MKEKGFVIWVSLVLAVCWAIYIFAVYVVSRAFVLDVGGTLTLIILSAFGAFLVYVTTGFIHAVVSD